ncbi:MAG TPA: hypothetical protein VE575_17715, partial [Acidimicrobiales bacterium]|nr:hypothetical protein [Acidimicrobiales bacterium]
MSEPLLGHGELAARCDPASGLTTVGPGSWGPAGTAGLSLGDGLELDVDIARPTTLVALTIEPPSGRAPGAHDDRLHRRLEALLGPPRAQALLRLVREPRGDPDGPGGDRQDAADHGDGAATGVAPALHRAALAQAIACAPGAPPPVQAVGLLEAAAELAQLDGRLDVAPLVRHDLDAGVGLLVDLLADGGVPLPGRRAARELTALLRRVSRILGDQPLAADRLAALAHQLERAHHGGRRRSRGGAAGVAGRDDGGRAAGTDLTAGARRVAIDLGSLPGALAEAGLAAWWADPAEVRVRIDGWADRRGGLWARVFGDGVLVALAPLGTDGGDAVARLVVPPDTRTRLDVDVTDRPELPRPSPTLAATQRAMHVGRAAAQAERLGDRASALLRWRQCARYWARARDPGRVEAAHALARRAVGAVSESAHHPAGGRRHTGPLIVDLVAAGG